MSSELEHCVDDLFERSDKRIFEVLHRIAILAIENENEGLSQIPPASVSNIGDEIVATSSFEDRKLP